MAEPAVAKGPPGAVILEEEMKLISADGPSLELTVDGYQFPATDHAAASKDWDGNWLYIRGRVSLPDGRTHQFRDPCLTTWEWLGPRVGVQCLCEFRVREWTQEEFHASWHADTPPSRSSRRSGWGRKCSTTDARWSKSSRNSRSPRRPGTGG
ncbi:WapI family immunity protein [Arthrobacter gyeryongensis]|uniref:WapI family immunity protein n=1 Tax=Arthrobacter gyeryongensis TaxID=1650592 RepID=UPI003CD08DEE